MIAKPMRKLSTGLSSLGTLMSGALLGIGVSDDRADVANVAEVVTLVELIQRLRERVQVSKMQTSFIHHLTEPHALTLQFRTNFMT